MTLLISLSAVSADKDEDQIKKDKDDAYYERCMKDIKCEQKDEKDLKACKLHRALKCLAPEKEEQ